jgi:hypothetical protein
MRPIHASILAVAATLLVTAPALAESKVSQCKRLAIADNKLENQLRSLSQQKGGDLTEYAGRQLKIFENGAKQVRAMRLEDVTLRGFQQRAAEWYEQVHDDLVDLYDASVQQNKAAAQQAMQKLSTRRVEANTINKQFRQYCQR